MSVLKYKFFEALPSLVLSYARVAVNDSLLTILGKLQAQIDKGAIGGRVFSDNTSGVSTKTWTVPAGVYRVKFCLIGPGANGVAGQNAGPRSGGGGGGAGAVAEGWLDVAPGGTLSYFLPAANSGTAAWIVANSGTTQISCPAGAQGTAGGIGGTGGAAPTIGSAHVGFVVGSPGKNGRGGFSATLALTIHDDGGDGADTRFGSGGKGGKDAAGTNASGFGAGGGGCPQGQTPGNGAAAGLRLEY